jgi:hypothetical protein
MGVAAREAADGAEALPLLLPLSPPPPLLLFVVEVSLLAWDAFGAEGLLLSADLTLLLLLLLLPPPPPPLPLPLLLLLVLRIPTPVVGAAAASAADSVTLLCSWILLAPAAVISWDGCCCCCCRFCWCLCCCLGFLLTAEASVGGRLVRSGPAARLLPFDAVDEPAASGPGFFTAEYSPTLTNNSSKAGLQPELPVPMCQCKAQ